MSCAIVVVRHPNTAMILWDRDCFYCGQPLSGHPEKTSVYCPPDKIYAMQETFKEVVG